VGPLIKPGCSGTLKTVTSTLSFAILEALSVTVKIYQVVKEGDAVGIGEADVKPGGLEVHE
jgi:hypothetical protein